MQERDGRTGKEQILLERRIGERARRVEKSRDLTTGDEETVDNSVSHFVSHHPSPVTSRHESSSKCGAPDVPFHTCCWYGF
jgi:hypothetical protein